MVVVVDGDVAKKRRRKRIHNLRLHTSGLSPCPLAVVAAVEYALVMFRAHANNW